MIGYIEHADVVLFLGIDGTIKQRFAMPTWQMFPRLHFVSRRGSPEDGNIHTHESIGAS